MEEFLKKLQNLWFYYKLQILIGLTVVLVLGYFGLQKQNMVQPDYHIGLVREIPCTEAELSALENRFLAAGEDINGDGTVTLQIHTYYVDLADDAPNAGVQNAETIAALDADLVGGMSGIFLLEDADTFRRITNSLVSDAVLQMENGLSLTLRKDAAAAYTALADRLF